MKTLPLIALILAAAGLGYLATSRMLSLPSDTVSEQARLDWLAHEFALTPDALATIRRLKADYAPICADHCAAIAVADRSLADATTAAARASAEAELDRLRKVCADSTRRHLADVAACMPPAQGRRFLEMMEPRVAHTDGRVGAPSLDSAP